MSIQDPSELMQIELGAETWSRDWLPAARELTLRLPYTLQQVTVGLQRLRRTERMTLRQAEKALIVCSNYGMDPDKASRMITELVRG